MDRQARDRDVAPGYCEPLIRPHSTLFSPRNSAVRLLTRCKRGGEGSAGVRAPLRAAQTRPMRQLASMATAKAAAHAPTTPGQPAACQASPGSTPPSVPPV